LPLLSRMATPIGFPVHEATAALAASYARSIEGPRAGILGRGAGAGAPGAGGAGGGPEPKVPITDPAGCAVPPAWPWANATVLTIRVVANVAHVIGFMMSSLQEMRCNLRFSQSKIVASRLQATSEAHLPLLRASEPWSAEMTCFVMPLQPPMWTMEREGLRKPGSPM
jgi:hypothetical protein